MSEDRSEQIASTYFSLDTNEFANSLALIAKLARIHFNAMLTAGFSETQALFLTSKFQLALYRGDFTKEEKEK